MLRVTIDWKGKIDEGLFCIRSRIVAVELAWVVTQIATDVESIECTKGAKRCKMTACQVTWSVAILILFTGVVKLNAYLFVASRLEQPGACILILPSRLYPTWSPHIHRFVGMGSRSNFGGEDMATSRDSWETGLQQTAIWTWWHTRLGFL